ncbi:SHOCT domain-containing protein [Phytohabitans flavus]|uniref:SHOCT domain-containing protein n=1 Tax=Phytohabitans flavus TaxID=1076124 RepID=UPI0036403CE7
MASRADPRRFKIRWDQVPTGRQSGAAQAARLAETLNAQGGTWQQPPSNVSLDGAVYVNGRPASPAEAEQIAGMLGVTLPGTGTPASPGGAGQDRLARLERLAALYQSGALSAAEYERLKAEILNG